MNAAILKTNFQKISMVELQKRYPVPVKPFNSKKEVKKLQRSKPFGKRDT